MQTVTNITHTIQEKHYISLSVGAYDDTSFYVRTDEHTIKVDGLDRERMADAILSEIRSMRYRSGDKKNDAISFLREIALAAKETLQRLEPEEVAAE